jgi:hypothetical protein
MIKALEFEALVSADAGAAEAYDIQSAHAIIAPRDREWRQVFADGRAALHQCQHAHASELVHKAIPGNNGAILDEHVATEERTIGNHNFVPNNRVMPNVAMGHQQVAIPNLRGFTGCSRTMHGNVLAKNIVVSDAQDGWFTIVFQILRGITYDAARMKAISRANPSDAGNVHVGADFTFRADDDISVNHGVGADSHRWVELRFGVYDCGRVDHV